MTTVRLVLSFLGPFRVTLDGEAITDFRADTARALLAYLAMHPGIAHRREVLAGLLWPEAPEVDARRNLRVTLSRLRDAIRDREVPSSFLEITRNTIEMPCDIGCSIDVWRLRDALEVVKSHDHAQLEICDTCAEQLRMVDDLYRGEFLAGFSLDSAAFEEWVVVERERLHWEVLEALSSLTDYHEVHTNYEAVIAGARRQVALEPWRESAHRQWMRALSLSGHRNAALAQYEVCRRVLADELGVEPEAATLALYEQLRAGDWTPPAVSAPPTVLPTDTSMAPPMATPESSGDSLQPVGRLGEAASDVVASERRMVTVIQAEICGAEQLAARVDVETWATILAQLLRVVGAEVYRYGGEIERYDDSTMMALFGASTAHEDDPELAVLAALGMSPAFESKLGQLALDVPDGRDGLVALDLRAFVHTGEAIVTRSDPGLSQDTGTVIGDVVSSARHALEAVPPGAVRVGASTYRLVAPLFDWSDDLDTVPDRLDYEPISHKGSAAKGRGIPGMQSPLVGRNSEIDVLRGVIERLGAGDGGIVTLVGEAGIGKSRLVSELRTGAGPGLQWIEGRCLSHSETTAYAFWVSALHSVLGTRADTPHHLLGQELRGHLTALTGSSQYSDGDDLPIGYPFLAYLLGAPQSAAEQAMIAQMEPRVLQDAVFSAVERLFEAAAGQEPVILVCEDLHWSDSLSLRLLERLFKLMEHVPLLLLCIFRPERAHGCWRLRETARDLHEDRHTSLELQPLSEAESGLLLRNLLLSIPGPDGRQTVEGLLHALKDRILSRGEGNPYYVEELLRSLIQTEAIVCDADACQWQAKSEAAVSGIPETLYGVLRGRIDRLPPEARHVLQLASVIGRIFSYRLLAEIANRDVLDQALMILQREQLILDRSQGLDGAYGFRHQLTRDATYEALLHRIRRTLHRRVAEALERLLADRIDEHLGRLAGHWQMAGEASRAVHYFRRAGERAAVQYANDEGLRYLDRALALTADSDHLAVYDLLSRRVAIYDTVGDRDAQWADLERLRAVAEAPASVDAEGRRRRAEVALLKATYYEHTAIQPFDDEAIETAVHIARQIGDCDLEARAQLAWGRAMARSGDEASAVRHWEASRRLARQVGNRRLEAQVLRALGLANSVYSAETAMHFLQQAHRIHQEMGNRAGEGSVLGALASMALDSHLPILSMTYAEEALRLCRLTGLRREEGWALADVGMALYALGQYVESDKHLQQAFTCFRQVADPVGQSAVSVMRARVAHRLGDDRAGRAYGQSALALADQANAWEAGVAALTTLGEVCATQGDWRDARRAYSEAEARCLRLGWPQRLVGAWTGLARVALANGATDEAADYVQKILRYMEDDPDLHATGDPMRVYLICYEVLERVGDPTAGDLLGQAHRQLQRWAAAIEDADLRRSFLGNVPSHRAIVVAYEHLWCGQETTAP
ncbi:MAG: AAA family ATPase [Anaerolineae bacterium]|nr:AAA family ATPase [Anaerolineae bacterium]